MVMAAMGFAFQTALFMLIPLVSSRLEQGTAIAGILVGILAGIGVVSDGFVARATYRFGVRRVILAGSVLAAIGTVMLSILSLPSLYASTVVLGIATSFQATPILGGIASHAGKNQIRAQGTNAIAQRGGGLLAALMLGHLAAPDLGGDISFPVLASLTVAITVACLLLKPSIELGGIPMRDELGHRLVEVVSSSRALQAALAANATPPLAIIFGASFIPLILVSLSQPELILPCMVGRELVAIATAAILRGIDSRRVLFVTWVGSIVLSGAGVLVGAVSGNPWCSVISFSLMGASIGAGIMMGNVCIYDATTVGTRFYGFAAASIVSRLSGWGFPVVVGFAFNVSVLAASIVFVSVMLMVLVVFSAIRAVSANVVPENG